MSTPTKSGILNEIELLLADLYPDEVTSRRIVGHAGIEDGPIAFDARANVNWHHILREADLRRKVDILLATVIDEYPEEKKLGTLRTAFAAVADDEITETTDEHELVPSRGRGPWKAFLYTIVCILILFFVLGFIARESQHEYLGIPHGGGKEGPGEFSEALVGESASLMWQSLLIALRYCGDNPIGVVSAVAIVAFILFFHQSGRLRRFSIRPEILLSLVLVGSLGKILYFDVPTTFFSEFLLKNSLDFESFGVPPIFRARTRTIWRDTVCSRIGSMDRQLSRTICGDRDPSSYLRRSRGRFIINASWTLLLALVTAWSIGDLGRRARAGRKLTNWGIRALIVGSTFFTIVAILLVAFSFSRTARPTNFPSVCRTGEEAGCYYRMCISSTECYGYYPDLAGFESVPPGDGSLGRPGDVLTIHLQEIIGTKGR